MAPSTRSATISTFTTSRIAARPRVIPLYATSIPRRAKRPISLHDNLPPKPHIRIRSDAPEMSPIDISSASARSESPLTEDGEDEDEASTGDNSAPSQPRTIFVPRPSGVTQVKDAPWDEAARTTYRTVARQAVDQYLNVEEAYKDQVETNVAKARDYIEAAIPHFKPHQNHWGAILVLKEQFKSKRDKLVRMRRGEKEKEVEGEGEKTKGKKKQPRARSN